MSTDGNSVPAIDPVPSTFWTIPLTILKSILAAAVGEVESLAGGLIGRIPLGDLAAKALGYFIPLVVALSAFFGIPTGIGAAFVATGAVLVVNVVRLFLHIPLSL